MNVSSLLLAVPIFIMTVGFDGPRFLNYRYLTVQFCLYINKILFSIALKHRYAVV